MGAERRASRRVLDHIRAGLLRTRSLTTIPAENRELAVFLLEKKIDDKIKELAQDKKELSQTRFEAEAETLHSNFWTCSAAGYHMNDTIQEFVKPSQGAPQYESRPKEMAEMARAHHDSIQYQDKPEPYTKILQLFAEL
ncbi:hypothetical protein B0H12DRAFT_1283243 [Mycena haematopus]|nr:hypothetical protein B0H12DRAFT_1283243 [Mycena haematopus]